MLKLGLTLLAASASAFPHVKRQSEVSSAVASATSEAVESASSAVASATSSGSAAAPSGSAADYGTGLLAALRERQANTLATLLEPLAPQLVPVLESGEAWTLFAPGDEYLADVDTSNATAVQEILSYHLVYGSYPTDALMENMTVIAPTFLAASNLGANYTQLPLAFVKDVFGTTNIVSQNASVLANATYQNVLVKLIDGVLIPPGPVPEVLAEPELETDALLGALTSLLPDVASALNTTQGITVFAPSNEAVEAAMSALGSVDPSALTTVVQGHVLPQVVFSSNISDGLTATSLGGTPLTFTISGSTVSVEGNGVVAQIISTDNIADNGVVHVIDQLLFSGGAASGSASASGAASSAAGPVASASSAAESAVATATDAVASATEAVASAVPTSA